MKQEARMPTMPRVSIYEQLFGRRTPLHSHPDTHPSWLLFTMDNCPRCSRQHD